MKKLIALLLLAGVFCLSITACVSNKKYMALKSRALRDSLQVVSLKSRMIDALKNFNSNSSQVGIITKNGRVYVSLEDSLVFASASADISSKGRTALRSLATALNDNPDVLVTIEGHTDSIAIKSKRYEDNWALSTARSTAIARVLINEYGVIPNRITAVGRSQFNPIADNSTPEGRARNRRTEIILAPKVE